MVFETTLQEQSCGVGIDVLTRTHPQLFPSDEDEFAIMLANETRPRSK